MKKSILALAVVVVLGAIVYYERAAIALRVMARGAEAAMTSDTTAGFEDGLHLALCGAGGPLPDPKRSGPCVAVVAGKQLFVVDAGTNGLRNLLRIVDQMPGVYAVGVLSIFFTARNQRVGDLVAGTVVVQEPRLPEVGFHAAPPTATRLGAGRLTIEEV